MTPPLEIRKPGPRRQRGDLLIPFLTVVSDVAATVGAFVGAYWLRFDSGLVERLGIGGAEARPPFTEYLAGSAVMAVLWVAIFNGRKLYRARRSVVLVDEFLAVVRYASVGMLVAMSTAFLYRGFSYSRIVFALAWVLSIGLIVAGRAVVAAVERSLYRRGESLRTALILGNDQRANDIHSRLHRHASFGFAISGYCADQVAAAGSTLSAVPYRGPIALAPQIIQSEGIDVVFAAVGSGEHAALARIVAECEGIDVEFMMVPDVLEVMTSQVRLREYEGIPFLTLKSNPMTVWGRISKRAMDLLVSAVLLVVLSPLLLLIALLIKATSHGPVLYTQERVGLDGRRFSMLKFRSMRTDSEEATGPVWASKRDPRRTPIGVLLRKTSLDELPQLINVLWGEMSLVGPRPERPYFVEQFRDRIPKYPDRHRVKTGVTGWAQVNGLRGDTSLEERIRYDLYYIENWSLTFDLKILLMTVRAALRFKEAN